MINIRSFTGVVFALLLAGLFACNKETENPNVLFILTDQWRASATGYAGDPNVKTPALDKFSEEAVTFRNAVSVCPVCTPYRASILTGRYPTSTGMFLNDAYLPPEELCLAEVYKENGYQTAYIGKWHLDGQGRFDFTPPDRRQGFDYWKALECSHDYNKMAYYEGNDPEIKYWEGYSPFAIAEDAMNYISDRADSESPFFLFVSIATPHFPHHSALPEYLEMYPESDLIIAPNVPEEMHENVRKELAGYYAHCTATDKAVGDLIQKVRDLNLIDKTLIVFTSDHGEAMGGHGVRVTQKQVPWFESAGVPLLIKYPGNKESALLNMSVTTPDISSTLLDLSGIDIPSTFEGESFASAVTKGKDLKDRSSLYMSVSSFASVKKEFKKEYRAIKTEKYTYVKALDGPWLLYDDENDPHQLNNLVSNPEYADILADMESRLSGELNRINDDFRPGEEYIKEWGYTVTKGGYIPYKSFDMEPQIPRR